jgi:four helix bundle protein
MKSVTSDQSSEFSEKIDSFKDLMVWQKSLLLLKSVYRATKNFPREEMWGLTSQIKRSAISIGSNIAEGSSKRSTREFIRFLNISYGSLSELEAQLIMAYELEFLPHDDLSALTERYNEIGKMLNGLIRSLTNKLNSEL